MKKVPLGVTIGLMALTAAAAVSISYSTAIRQTNAKIHDINERQAMFSKLGEIDTLTRRSFYSAIDEQSLAEALCGGYAQGLNDENALYLDAEACRSYAEGGADPVIGIGAEVVPTHDALRVSTVYPESPAETAGVKRGDIILAIDGESVSDMSYLLAVSRLNRSEGTPVQLNIIRKTEEVGETVPDGRMIAVTCAKFKPQTVESTLLEGNIGYISIARLRTDTAEAFDKAVDRLIEQKADGLVIDLRDCGGTAMASAAHVADRLLDEADTVRVKNGAGELKVDFTAEKGKVNVPVTCIINSVTGGAGEVLAAALQDAGIPCVGESTAGKAEKTIFSQLSDGSAMILPVGSYIRADGSLISDGGVRPNRSVTLTEAQTLRFRLGNLPAGEDPQVADAVKAQKD